MDKVQDLFIVGGGINGCGIARDAAGRGYSVELVEMNDIGSGTSSWSTKLIHGGLRYLEHYEFMLVRASLIEREVLLHLAPHLIRPIRLVLPHHQGLRPAWLPALGAMALRPHRRAQAIAAHLSARLAPTPHRHRAAARIPQRL